MQAIPVSFFLPAVEVSLGPGSRSAAKPSPVGLGFPGHGPEKVPPCQVRGATAASIAGSNLATFKLVISIPPNPHLVIPLSYRLWPSAAGQGFSLTILSEAEHIVRVDFHPREAARFCEPVDNSAFQPRDYTMAAVMDYEALKEQWSDVEERDGVRLSWNVFPSSRMVSTVATSLTVLRPCLTNFTGSFAPRGTHWSFIYPFEGETGVAPFAIRTGHLQTAMSLRTQSVLVKQPDAKNAHCHADNSTARSTFARASGSAPSVCRATPCHRTIRTSRPMPSLLSCTPRTQPSSTD